ncbi:MAG TPA: hypothetical protein PKW33_02095 [Anaerolineaceae bacterium]|nr:hypothetical protein [Anaerolineaceae bacterium]HPN50351.1 hypothetical protein [Anaerolineaceae bacterium]
MVDKKEENKRKLQRRHLIYYLRVFDDTTNALLGHLVDITPEGVMLISENPIPTNVVYHLRMELPQDILGQGELEFVGKSIWSKKDVNPRFYDTGFEMIEVAQQHFTVIEQLVELFGFHD